MSRSLNPPVFFKNAVAKEHGWHDPKTGEMLVSVNHLLKKIQEEHELAAKEGRPSRAYDTAKVVTTLLTPTELLQELKEEETKPVQNYPGARRGPKPKNKHLLDLSKPTEESAAEGETE